MSEPRIIAAALVAIGVVATSPSLAFDTNRCRDMAAEFAKSPDILSRKDLADLFSCVDTKLNSRLTSSLNDLPPLSSPPNMSAACPVLAQEFSDQPDNMPLVELAVLRTCLKLALGD